MEDLLLINSNEFQEQIKERHQQKGGVYKVIALRDGQRVLINRFLGADPNGILYIGKATSFIERVTDLKKSISPEYKGSGHICGRRYKANPNIAKLFPYHILHIELIETDTPEEMERSLLTEYASFYGEVPPLNAI